MLNNKEEPEVAAPREFFEEAFDTLGTKKKEIQNLKKNFENFFKDGTWVKYIKNVTSHNVTCHHNSY